MPRLEGHEGHGLHRLDGRAAHRAGIAVDPARHVDGAERGRRRYRRGARRGHPGGGDRDLRDLQAGASALDERAGRTVEVARQAGPEQGVDHEIAGRQRAALGFVAARLLAEAGYAIDLFCLGEASKLTGDAARAATPEAFTVSTSARAEPSRSRDRPAPNRASITRSQD
jgi:hypothetical protein